MAEPHDFGHLRDELDAALAELENRLARARTDYFGDDETTLNYRQFIVFFRIARSFASELDKQARRPGMVVLRLEDQPPAP